MSALTDTLAARTALTDAQAEHIARLVGEWQLLSDLAFADLLLWVPVAVPAAEAGSVPAFLCVAQCRPTTGPTAYQHDQVGVLQVGSRVAPLRVAYNEGRIFREVDPDWDGDLPIRREAIPVRFGDRVVAVIGRDANLASVRTPSQLELVYLQSAADLAGMIADGTFPASASPLEESAGPRVGDGLVRLEPDGTIIYASPNALSAFNRLGVTGNVLSEPIDALTSTVAARGSWGLSRILDHLLEKRSDLLGEDLGGVEVGRVVSADRGAHKAGGRGEPLVDSRDERESVPAVQQRDRHRCRLQGVDARPVGDELRDFVLEQCFRVAHHALAGSRIGALPSAVTGVEPHEGLQRGSFSYSPLAADRLPTFS